MEDILVWLDSGLGIIALIATVVIHAVIMGRWAARVETQVDTLRVSLPDLQSHRHQTAIALAEHSARLIEGETRMRGNTKSIEQVRAEIEVLVRLDERIGVIQERLAKIELALDRRGH